MITTATLTLIDATRTGKIDLLLSPLNSLPLSVELKADLATANLHRVWQASQLREHEVITLLSANRRARLNELHAVLYEIGLPLNTNLSKQLKLHLNAPLNGTEPVEAPTDPKEILAEAHRIAKNLTNVLLLLPECHPMRRAHVADAWELSERLKS